MTEREQEVKARPIIFSGDMVRALLDGRKTQTRRVVRPQPPKWAGRIIGPRMYEPETVDKDGMYVPGESVFGVFDDAGEWGVKCPYGQPGDLLYVRETWAVGNIYDNVAPRNINPGGKPGWCGIRYAATCHRNGIKDRPSIHMPRWASRLTLRITDVRIKPVQDISHDDALAEGVDIRKPDSVTVRNERLSAAGHAFADLWDSINAERGYGWDANPWVWAISFDVHHYNVDDLAKHISMVNDQEEAAAQMSSMCS